MAVADIFSPVAFFICLREVLEAGIITVFALISVAVLLGFINQIIPAPSSPPVPSSTRSSTELLSDLDQPHSYGTPMERTGVLSRNDTREERQLGQVIDREKMIRAMRLQIWTGAILGGLAAAMVGAIFLFVFYHYTHNLWQDAENLWEGGFCAIAAILILIMGLAFLRLPHAQTKWRLKLLSAYKDKHESGHGTIEGEERDGDQRESKKGKGGRMILFGLPFITVLREGLEGVVFLGGIGLSEKPLAVAGGAFMGLVIGTIIAYTLFSSSAPLQLRTFTTLSTLLLFLIGAGLSARAAFGLERQYFINGVGAAAAESGNGPGSFRVAGNIWKLTYANPEPGAEDGNGYWQLAQSIVGWNNVGTVWTVSTYAGYWIVIILTLVYLKWKEGRTAVCGVRSKRGWQREWIKRQEEGRGEEEEGLLRREEQEINYRETS